MILKYIIKEDNVLIKDFMINQSLSRILCKKIKLYGEIKVNGINRKNYNILKRGDILELIYDEKINEIIKENDKPLTIIYEDEYIIIIDKEYNLACLPTKKHFDDNLISRLKYYYKTKGIFSNYHVLTRLDYSTAGLVLVAKEGYIQMMFSKIKIDKYYHLICEGILDTKQGVIETFIERVAINDIRRKVSDKGKRAITEYKVLAEYGDSSFVECKLITGRTHQLRVHFSYINHPIIGDDLYGNKKERLMLLSKRLSFVHPILNVLIELESKEKFPLI